MTYQDIASQAIPAEQKTAETVETRQADRKKTTRNVLLVSTGLAITLLAIAAIVGGLAS